MRTLPLAIFNPGAGTGEILKEATFQAHLFKLVATTTHYWCDIDQDVYFDSKYWYASGIQFSDFSSAIDQATATGSLTIPNADKVFSDLSLAEDLRNKAFTIYRVWLTNALGVIGNATEAELVTNNQVVFDGVIESIGSDRATAKIDIASFGIAGEITTPRRIFEGTCAWVNIGGFKGTWCAYPSGSPGTWCDGSKARCVALGNQLNFGGWEKIAELQNQEVYWGRRVKTWGKK